MWLSKQTKKSNPTSEADLGVTTISGSQVGVLTKGEVRALPVFGPGGYIWQPANGDSVLVIKGGPGGEESCVAGKAQAGTEGLQPGEVCLHAPGGAAIRLRNDGSVELQGRVLVTGQLVINGKECQVEQCGGLVQGQG